MACLLKGEPYTNIRTKNSMLVGIQVRGNILLGGKGSSKKAVFQRRPQSRNQPPILGFFGSSLELRLPPDHHEMMFRGSYMQCTLKSPAKEPIGTSNTIKNNSRFSLCSPCFQLAPFQQGFSTIPQVTIRAVPCEKDNDRHSELMDFSLEMMIPVRLGQSRKHGDPCESLATTFRPEIIEYHHFIRTIKPGLCSEKVYIVNPLLQGYHGYVEKRLRSSCIAFKQGISGASTVFHFHVRVYWQQHHQAKCKFRHLQKKQKILQNDHV